MTSHIDLEGDAAAIAAAANPIDSAAALYGSTDLAATSVGAMFSADVALVSSISRQVEMARTPLGARAVAKSILAEEYGLGQSQFTCLNTLWTNESHWNYKANNPKSTARGIAQMLGETNHAPKVQIDNGLRYIKKRYGQPCTAWKFWRSHYWY